MYFALCLRDISLLLRIYCSAMGMLMLISSLQIRRRQLRTAYSKEDQAKEGSSLRGAYLSMLRCDTFYYHPSNVSRNFTDLYSACLTIDAGKDST
jgi:hypothetical protein